MGAPSFALSLAAATLLLSACQVTPTTTDAASTAAPVASAPAAQASAPTPSWTAESAIYRCEGGQQLAVSYINLHDGDSLAVLAREGKTHVMRIAPSGSGARYIALDEQASWRWHTKGAAGTLSFLAADHTAQEKTVLRDCLSLPQTPR